FPRLNGWTDMKKIEKRFHGIPSLTSEQCVRAVHARSRHPRGVGGGMLRRGSQMWGTSEWLTGGVVDWWRAASFVQINYSIFELSRLDNSHVWLVPLSCNTFDFKSLRR